MKSKIFTSIVAILILAAVTACAPVSASLGFPSASQSQVQSAVVPAAPAAQTSPTSNTMRTLTVSGTGTVMLDPDIARVTVGVHTEDENISTGVETNNTNVKKVREALIGFGIDKADIQTQNFSVYTMQNYDSGGKSTGQHYSIDNTLIVTVRDLTKLGKLLGEVTASGANNINGITFDVSDKSQALVDARVKAMADAQKQAGEMAKNLQANLGEVQSAVVTTADTTFSNLYGLGGGGNVQAASNVPISAGQINVQVNVQIVYEIE
jgi:uncharacterized protein YggE